jgi:hypothetical protein
MPWAHQAAVHVDAAAREVGAQVATLATHSEVLAVVADGVLSDSGNGVFGDARSWDGMTHRGSLVADDPFVAVRIVVRDVATMSWMFTTAHRVTTRSRTIWTMTSDAARACCTAHEVTAPDRDKLLLEHLDENLGHQGGRRLNVVPAMNLF